LEKWGGGGAGAGGAGIGSACVEALGRRMERKRSLSRARMTLRKRRGYR
jgi:hypothetical protein